MWQETKLDRPAVTGQRKPCRQDAKLRSFRAYYSGNDGETLTDVRRGKTEPHPHFIIITQGLEGLTLKAQTLISRLYHGPGQKQWPKPAQWWWRQRWGCTDGAETWTEARAFKGTEQARLIRGRQSVGLWVGGESRILAPPTEVRQT